MKIDAAIQYLENSDKDISAAQRFKVLTGFDTQTQTKDPNNWVSMLSNEGILTTLGQQELGAIGTVCWVFGAMKGLDATLKEQYKGATLPSDGQSSKQEIYINTVLNLLKKYQHNEMFENIEFADVATQTTQIKARLMA